MSESEIMSVIRFHLDDHRSWKLYRANYAQRLKYTRHGDDDQTAITSEDLIAKVINDLEHTTEFLECIYAKFSEAQWYPCSAWHPWTNQEEQAAIEERLKEFCAKRNIEYRTVNSEWPWEPR